MRELKILLGIVCFLMFAAVSYAEGKPKPKEKDGWIITEVRGKASHNIITGQYWCKNRADLCYVKMEETDCNVAFVRIYGPEGTVQHNGSTINVVGVTHEFGYDLDESPVPVFEIVPACR